MTAALLLALAGVVGVFAGVVALRAGEMARLRGSLVAYRLRFPRGLEAEAVGNVLAGVAGMLPPRHLRWLQRPFVVCEVHADAAGIRHVLLVPQRWALLVENVLQAAVPSVRYERQEAPSAAAEVAAEYGLNTPHRVLLGEPADLSAKLLTALQPLADGESVVVQWVVAPTLPVEPARRAKPDELRAGVLADSVLGESEAVAALRRKQREPLLAGVARVGVVSATRPAALLGMVEAVWQQTRAPGLHPERRAMSNHRAGRRLVERVVPLVGWPGEYATSELAELIGWPVGVDQVPGLQLAGYRLLAPSPLVPEVGTVLADSTFPGMARPLALDLEARLRHVHVFGPTGTGKSVTLANMAVQDMAAGYGVVMLDPKGDLIAEVLARMPEHRRADVIVLDPADDARPVGLNPLRPMEGVSAEVVVENLVGLFKALYGANWGPRTDDIMRAALLALSRTGRATLCEVPLLLTDKDARRRITADLDDPVGLGAFFDWYDRLRPAEQLTMTAPALNKVRAFTMRPRVRGIIGQATPLLDMRSVLAEQKILLVSLASGLLGEEAAALLGALVVAELWHATTARAALPPAERRPVMAYLDEWQHFVALPTPMATVLAEARGLGLGMTLAHQYLHQLPADTRSAVLSTARSRVVFQLQHEDAALAARPMAGMLSERDLQGLGAYEVVVQAYAGGSTQPPATGVTRPLPPPCSDPEALRAASRQRYGMDATDVEARLRQRHARSGERKADKAASAPVGRKPRNRS